jgi:hypothetical protein
MTNSLSRESDLDPGQDRSTTPEPTPASAASPQGVDETSPIDADELLDSLLGDDAIDPSPVRDGAPPDPPSTFEIPEPAEPRELTEVELHRLPPPSIETLNAPAETATPEHTAIPEHTATPERTAVSDEGAGSPDLSTSSGLTARATTPELGRLELRQIAGLTSGTSMPLEAECYDFAQDNALVGFQVQVDRNDRAVVIPRAATTKIDSVEIEGPAVIGLGVLDVGSARFLVRHRRERKRATDWLDLHEAADSAEPLIEVPRNFGLDTGEASQPAEAPSRRKRRLRRKRGRDDTVAERPKLDPVSWEFIERIRSARVDLTDRERYLHPDPAELAERARHRAPILAIRPPGHPLFAKVGVIAADMPWMPRFDDIAAIPDSLGGYLKPLMSLPSMPIAADLMIGPLGIVGHPSATMACARHVVTSLYGLSTPDLQLHLATSDDRRALWDWSYELLSPGPIDTASTFPVVVVDGMANLEVSGLTHADAIEHRAGVVFLADSVEDLPSYCGTVLQVDGVGSGLLTNHLGNIITGTPIGITTAFASEMAADLVAVMDRRHHR